MAKTRTSSTSIDHAVVISPDGAVNTLWTEAIPLEQIGKLTVRRWSEVEWHKSKKLWQVRCKCKGKKKVMFENKSREACLTYEKKLWNSMNA